MAAFSIKNDYFIKYLIALMEHQLKSRGAQSTVVQDKDGE